jgi:hypothetical protein
VPLSLFPTAAVCFYGSARLTPTRRGRPANHREEAGRIPRGAPRTTCRIRLDKTAKLPRGLTETATAVKNCGILLYRRENERRGYKRGPSCAKRVARWEGDGCAGLFCLLVQPSRRVCRRKVGSHVDAYIRSRRESMRSMQVRADMKVKLGYRAVRRPARRPLWPV